MKPKNTNIHLALSEDEKTITIEIRTSHEKVAIKLYEKLESLLMQALRVDLENDWQDDKPENS